MFIPPNNNNIGQRDSDTVKCVAISGPSSSAGRASRKNSKLPDEFMTLLYCGKDKFKVVKYVYLLSQDTYFIESTLYMEGAEICVSKDKARQLAVTYAFNNNIKLHPKFFVYFYP